MRNPRTEKQLTQRNRFSLIGKFLKCIIPVIRVGFKHVAYNPTTEEAVYDLNVATRATGNGLLEIPPTWDGAMVEAFVAFASEDGAQVSDTVYTG